MVQKKKKYLRNENFLLSWQHLSLNKSSDCFIALVVELFRSLTAGSFADPSLHTISSGIKYTIVLSVFQMQEDQTGGRLILD